jgi:hypothetical protein
MLVDRAEIVAHADRAGLFVLADVLKAPDGATAR